MNDTEQIIKELDELEKEHQDIEFKIENNNQSSDQLLIQRFKKRKLWLKDRIIYLKSFLYPDVIA